MEIKEEARRFRITCSCGKEAYATYNEDKQVFECPGWQFSLGEAVGWHCGHYQAAYTALPTIPQMQGYTTMGYKG